MQFPTWREQMASARRFSANTVFVVSMLCGGGIGLSGILDPIGMTGAMLGFIAYFTFRRHQSSMISTPIKALFRGPFGEGMGKVADILAILFVCYRCPRDSRADPTRAASSTVT